MTKVKIFNTTTCVYFKVLKEYLSSKSAAYEEVLLDVQTEVIQESIDTCDSMGVTCTHITLDNGDEVKILGFDKTKIDASLGLA